MGEIGEPKRIIIVQPLEDPVPAVPEREPVTEPERVPAPKPKREREPEEVPA